MSDEPVIAQKGPYRIDLLATYRYAYCACGLSKSQPFCDGSHKGTGIAPVKFTLTEAKTVALCNCKHTCGGPFCDGSHSRLPA